MPINLQQGIEAHAQRFTLMPADVYYITGVPTAVYPGDVVTVAGLTLALSFLATLYPAWRASRTDPATALRYE